MFSLKDHVAEQIAWSEATFGPREVRNHVGPLNHLLKEIEEIRKDPKDIVERVDALFLVIDATWRAKSEHLDLFPVLWCKAQVSPAVGCTEHDYLGWLEDEARSRVEAREGVTYGYLHLFRYALCSALLAGFTLEALGEVMTLKLATNKERKWPDWRTVQAGQPIEHVRSDEEMMPADQLQEELDGAMAEDDARLMTEMDLKHAEEAARVPFVDFHPAEEYIARQRRDAFARAALQGLLACGYFDRYGAEHIAGFATELADRQIEALDKPVTG